MRIKKIRQILNNYIDEYEDRFMSRPNSSLLPFQIDFLLNNTGVTFHENQIIQASVEPDAFFNVFRILLESVKDKDLVSMLFMMVHKSQKIFLYLMLEKLLSKSEKGRLLRECWVYAEFPFIYSNLYNFDFIREFSSINPKYYMDEKEMLKYSELPDVITCYRGVFNESFKDGYSYSLSYERALWFAKRFKDNSPGTKIFLSINGIETPAEYKGCVYEITCPKQYILAYFQREDEVVIDINRVSNSVRLLEGCPR